MTMSNPKAQVYADMLDMARKETLKRAGTMPDDRWLAQLAQGKATPLWLMGHLTGGTGMLVLTWTLGEAPIMPQEQALLFMGTEFGGAPITTDPDAYPPWQEIIDMYAESMTRAADGVRAMDDGDLALPLQGDVPEAFQNFFSNREVTLQMVIGHDAEHRGQLGLLAKAELPE